MKRIIALILLLSMICVSGCSTLSDAPIDTSGTKTTVSSVSSVTTPGTPPVSGTDPAGTNDPEKGDVSLPTTGDTAPTVPSTEPPTTPVTDPPTVPSTEPATTTTTTTTPVPSTTPATTTTTTPKTPPTTTPKTTPTTTPTTTPKTTPTTTPTTTPSTTPDITPPTVPDTSEPKDPEPEAITPLSKDDYYGYQWLAKSGGNLLTAYLRISATAEKMDTDTVSLADLNLTVDEVKLVYRYYRADFPQHFWLDTRYGWSYSGSKAVSLKLYYTMTKAERDAAKAELQNAVTEILSGITPAMDTYQREKYIHDQMVKLAEYDRTLAQSHVHDLYGALVSKLAVCEGYARAFQYLMYQIGIPALFVSGTATNSSGIPESHAWNIVKIDGEYYLVDVTWDDPLSNMGASKPIYYAYFNCTDEQFKPDHTPDDDNYPLPACTATTANYFVREGTIVDDFDVDQLAALIRAARSVGEVHIYVNGSIADFRASLAAEGDRVWRKAGISSIRMMFIGQEVVLRFS